MDRLKLSLLGAVAMAAVIGANGAAHAADLLPPPPVIEAPEVVVKKSGWYLRGDISYDFQDLRGAHILNQGNVAAFNKGYDVDDSFNIGLGVGYQVNDNFRVDLTGEYVFDAGFHAGTQSDRDCFGNAGIGAACMSSEESEVSKFKLLANAYYDIGHFGGFTPYVGAGIGGAYVKYDDVTSVNTCTTPAHPQPLPGQPNPYQCVHPAPPAPVVPGAQVPQQGPTAQDPVKYDGDSSWRFAWALHAGGAYSISDHLKLDIGYTFSRIEEGKIASNRGFGQDFYDKGYTDHTIRAGLRYHLW